MATNLGTTDGATFNAANMKPESADQIDALWGQNMADDLAFLRWNTAWAARKLFSFGAMNASLNAFDGTLVGTERFVCYGTDAEGTLSGTLRVSFDDDRDAAASSKGTFYINGAAVQTFTPVSGGTTYGFTQVMDNTYTIGNLYEASMIWAVDVAVNENVIPRVESCYAFQFPTAEAVK